MSGPSAPRLVRGAEVALLAVTLSVVLGMDRLFSEPRWLWPLVTHAVLAHVVVTVLRRRGLSLPLAALATALAAVVAITWIGYFDTTAAGVPTGDTWRALGDDLTEAWRLYQEVKAPADPVDGFIVASAAAIWFIAFLADWAAFRVWVSYEATLPASTLFLLTAMLGVDAGQGWAVAVFAAATVGFLLVHRTAGHEGSVRWVSTGARRGQRAVLAAGAALGSVAVLAGTLAGPSLPGADEPGFLDVDSFRGAPPRVTVSPLVDIRSRLVDQSAAEAFRVEASAPAYWRLTSLDSFDGQRWKSSSSYDDAGDELPIAVEPEADLVVVEQEYTITGLAALWLPGAFLPRGFEAISEGGVLFDEDSATLIVDRDRTTSDGMQYRVTSTVPRFDPDALAAADEEIPGDIADRYLDLPEGFSPRVVELARTIAPDTLSPYERARALQDHLREFRYDLEVPAGHGSAELERFLFDVQAGYCEQFSAAYAAMARAVGLPSRVAVGFTPGEQDPASPGTYVVRGVHAHAWPEVFLPGAGWVPFEPTPGRGQPFAEAHTDVEPTQAGTGSQGTEPLPTSTTVPIPSEDQLPGETPTTGPRNPDEVQTGFDAAAGGDDEGGAEGFVTRAGRVLGWILLAAAALAVLYAVVVPLLLWVRRRRRRAAATAPLARIEVRWAEVVERARALGYREDRSLTPRERAARLAERLPAAAPEPVTALGAALEVSAYAPGAGELEANVADAAADEALAAIVRVTDWRGRLAHHLDARPHLARWRRDQAAQHRHITVAVGTQGDARRVVGTARRGAD